MNLGERFELLRAAIVSLIAAMVVSLILTYLL